MVDSTDYVAFAKWKAAKHRAAIEHEMRILVPEVLETVPPESHDDIGKSTVDDSPPPKKTKIVNSKQAKVDTNRDPRQDSPPPNEPKQEAHARRKERERGSGIHPASEVLQGLRPGTITNLESSEAKWLAAALAQLLATSMHQ